jgi:hypothetical protein
MFYKICRELKPHGRLIIKAAKRGGEESFTAFQFSGFTKTSAFYV